MDLRVWNRSKKDLRPYPHFNAGDLTEHGFYFETCLRHLWVDMGHVRNPMVPPDYEGVESYAFLLKVLTGLDSPFVAETEVWGQFRDQSEKAPACFTQLFQRLNQDVKQVRTQHLLGLGSVSYGGVSRFLLKCSSGIALLGAGGLGKEIVPWVMGESPSFKWLARNTRDLNGFEVRQFRAGEIASGMDLIIAAPISNRQLESLPSLNRVLDFRSEAEFNGRAERIYTFEDLKQLAENHRSGQVKHYEAGLRLIDELARVRFLESKARPFGWEDLCG